MCWHFNSVSCICNNSLHHYCHSPLHWQHLSAHVSPWLTRGCDSDHALQESSLNQTELIYPVLKKNPRELSFPLLT
jgi:hypothetical protein